MREEGERRGWPVLVYACTCVVYLVCVKHQPFALFFASGLMLYMVGVFY